MESEPEQFQAVHPATLDDEQLLEQCDARRQRRSGPGGQHRNKVETAVVLTHRDSGVEGQASERRSQQENHRVALFRLRVNLALHIRRRCALEEPPSPLWQSRCRGGRLSVSASHVDFPALLAEAIDVLAAHGEDLPAAAGQLGVTASQLTKFLKLEPRALQQLNDRRSQLGLRPLR